VSNGAQNCALEICCPPGSREAVLALTKLMVKDGLDKEYAEPCATWILRHFDLAERGTLKELKASVVRVWQKKNPH